MERTKSDTLQYLIKQGEKTVSEASKGTIKEPTSEDLIVLMHELLALKYHDALRSFEQALEIDRENEAAIEGFCYALAEAISHYEHAGLSRLADTIRVKAVLYQTDRLPEIAKRSKRMGSYLLGIVREIFPE